MTRSINLHYLLKMVKMANGSQFYRALESVSIASALSTALYHLRFAHARSESINADCLELQLLTARKKEWRPATTVSLLQAVTRHTTLAGIELTIFDC